MLQGEELLDGKDIGQNSGEKPECSTYLINILSDTRLIHIPQRRADSGALLCGFASLGFLFILPSCHGFSSAQRVNYRNEYSNTQPRLILNCNKKPLITG